MDVKEYQVMLLKAPIINLGMAYGDLSNPPIYERFAAFAVEHDVTHVWDAFANRNGESIHFFLSRGIAIISHNVDPAHPEVLKRDSTKEGPGIRVEAVIIHPSYFGSCLLSKEEGELSALKELDDYNRKLSGTVHLAVDSLTCSGYVCAVGRTYRTGNRRIDLGEWFVEAFCEHGFELVEVWKSVPDVAIVMQRR